MLALKLLIRNWRSGELRLLAIALLIAVTVVSGISIFVDRLEASLQLQTAELLGADSVVISPTLHPDSWKQEADKRGVKHLDFIRLQTMAYAGEESTLISLQVVNPGYPLRGQIFIADSLANPDGTKNRGVLTKQVPMQGEVWVGAELFVQLDMQLGQNVEVGNLSLKVSKVLTDSPEPFSRYPIVMMNRGDLKATGVIMPGSQVRYRWLLASDNTEALESFKQWLETELNPHQKISDAHSRSDWLQRTVKSSTNLLSFSAVISVLLAGVAISIATRQFVERHINQVAVKKSLGATSRQIKQLYLGQLLLLGLVASISGLGLGHLMQGAIANYMLQFFDVALAPTSILPYVYSLLSGIGFLLFFALLPLWHLPDIPPIKVLRSDLHTEGAKLWLQLLFACLALFGLIALFSKDIELTVKVCGVLVLVALLTLLLARLMLWLSKKWASRTTGFWRLGLVNMQRRHQHNTLLIAVFSTTLMALLSLTLMRNSFWHEIQEFASEEEANFYLMNISKDEKPIIEDFLTSLKLEYDDVYPTIVGRVTKVNGQSPAEDKADYWVFKWDVWMTWFDELPENQALLAGSWWPELEPAGEGLVNISVREDVMEELSLSLGDILTFSIGGQLQDAKITSVRPDLRGAALSVVFAFEPKDMAHHHHIYNIGLNVPPEHKKAIYQFGRKYPTIMIESIDAWLAKTQEILKQALDGALLVLLLTLFCGCLVLFAAVNSSIASRQQESGLLRAFGSSQKLILGSVWVEFVTVGLISGFIAVVASEILFYQLQSIIVEVPFIFHYQYWLPVIGGSALLVGLLGVAACKSTVSTPPNEVLRNAG